jgi:uracil phosphoribosyltransferase
MVFCDVAQDLLPTAKVQHLGMYRDEETLTPVWYYNKTLKINDPQKTHVFILDPMLATGNSAYDAVLCYIEKNIPLENIFFISLIAAPQGIKKLTDNFKGLKILTANVDKDLNSKGYIVPGLGDAGDKIYNT